MPAKITFVCKSMSPQDRAVGEPFTGAAGRWLYTQCLKPLGLVRKDVTLHALDNGPLPNNAGLVVAVGRPAGNALDKQAVVTVPHPFAVLGNTDTGETARKIARVGELLKSGEDAQTAWAGNWHYVVPPDGGRYVYQKHTRGDLVHYDLRFESKNTGKAWGWTIAGGDIKKKSDLSATPKKEHAADWLTTDGELPNDDTMEIIAAGTYEPVACHDNLCELELKNLTNQDQSVRAVFSSTGRNESGAQSWVSSISQDRINLAESTSGMNADSILLYEGALTTVGNAVEKTLAKITKADDSKHIVYGIVLDPMIIDAHGDWTPPAEIEKVAHDYLAKSRTVGHMHRTRDDESIVVESWVEQYPTQGDYKAALAGEPHRVTARKFGNDVIHSGTWCLGMKLGDKAWAEYKSGELNAFSPGGTGSREKLTQRDMPEIEVIDG